MEDIGHDYEAGKPWAVKLDLTLRLRDKSSQIEEQCRSDAVEATADRIVRKIDEFHRQPASKNAVPEKELWRRQALYLMPRRCQTWRDAIYPNFYYSTKLNNLEVIRAWENVLLLDDDDPEALTYLGVCLIGFNWATHEKTSAAKCIDGSRLVERAMRSHPNPVRADTFIACMAHIKLLAPARAKEMARYVLDHPDQFSNAGDHWVKAVLNMTAPAADGDLKALHAGWNRAIQNARNDPDSVILAFSKAPGAQKFPLDQAAAFLTPYLDSPDSAVQFVAHRAVGELLCRKNAAAGLQHLDKAIELLEKVYARCNQGSGYLLSNVYRLRIEACLALGRPEEAKKTALAGTRHFMKAARFDISIAWLYYYCVTEALGAGQEKESLAVCDAYRAAVERQYWNGRDFWPQMSVKREVLLARLAGKPIPGMDGLLLARGTAATSLRMLRMAATDQTLWLVAGDSRHSFGFGKALQ
jgi:hypothetical protein